MMFFKVNDLFEHYIDICMYVRILSNIRWPVFSLNMIHIKDNEQFSIEKGTKTPLLLNPRFVTGYRNICFHA